MSLAWEILAFVSMCVLLVPFSIWAWKVLVRGEL